MNDYESAAEWVKEAKNIVILAGAGMSLESGLPAFRTGANALYKSFHPALKGMSFEQLAHPDSFRRYDEKRLRLAWAFYYTRYKMYLEHKPHEGYHLLRDWCKDKNHFVFTTNGDGYFIRAGFENVIEVHGSIHYLQCSQNCSERVWPAELDMEVDEKTFYVTSALPKCPDCGEPARPNILLFGDGEFAESRHEKQLDAYWDFKQGLDDSETLCIEVGAGQTIPTCRFEYDYHLGGEEGVRLIRINPGEDDCQIKFPTWQIGLHAGSVEALETIQNISRKK